ncbi:MAG TPA: NAD-dependent epimerase/dehydratase family protein [Nitrospira sp.]|nr:NAD-dependent epimerase/dehydratase family protein [Nitrospira sp.]
MSAVLVTGAGGFLGWAVVKDLVDSGRPIRALVRQPSQASSFPPTIDVRIGDIRDAKSVKEATRGCETIIHLAGKAHAIDEFRAGGSEYESINVEGTRQLLEGAAAGGAHRFIFASSVKVFGEITNRCLDENAPPAPQSAYARSKWLAEQAVASYSADLRTVSLRLPLVYGPTRKGNLYRMIEAIDHRRFPRLPRVSAVRSMLHVNNLLLAIRVAAMANTFPRAMYIVTDARPYSITDVYDLLRKGLGKGSPHWRTPLWAMSCAARCGDVLQTVLNRRMPFSSSTLQKLIGPAWYSPGALIQEMGYKPQYDFESAVPEIIQHYRHTLAQCG